MCTTLDDIEIMLIILVFLAVLILGGNLGAWWMRERAKRKCFVNTQLGTVTYSKKGYLKFIDGDRVGYNSFYSRGWKISVTDFSVLTKTINKLNSQYYYTSSETWVTYLFNLEDGDLKSVYVKYAGDTAGAGVDGVTRFFIRIGCTRIAFDTINRIAEFCRENGVSVDNVSVANTR